MDDGLDVRLHFVIDGGGKRGFGRSCDEVLFEDM